MCKVLSKPKWVTDFHIFQLKQISIVLDKKILFIVYCFMESIEGTSSAQLGLAQRSSAFIRYLVCVRVAQRSSAFIECLVCLRFGCVILILIWIWSLVFDTSLIQILALNLDCEDAKNLHPP